MPDRTWTDEPSAEINCDHTGCSACGSYRAPRGRLASSGEYRFCLEHIRTYNAAWNYFAGMDRQEIERLQGDIPTWHRPTWPLGVRAPGTRDCPWHDPMNLMSGQPNGETDGDRGATAAAPTVPAAQRRAFATLDLQPHASLKHIKLRYKQLVKRFHPDANGGNPATEERLKHINQAYALLMNRGWS